MEPLDPELVGALLRPEAYPADARAGEGIAHVQTHLSHVFLLRERVYKLHKAVRFPFVDFSTRALRNEDSLRELRLNRRLAAEVYLGVAALRDGTVGAPGEELAPAGRDGAVFEHAVVMKRLTAGRDAQSLLERGELSPAHVDAIAGRIAEFHAGHGLGAPAPFAPAEWRERVLRQHQMAIRALRGEPALRLGDVRVAGRQARHLRAHGGAVGEEEVHHPVEVEVVARLRVAAQEALAQVAAPAVGQVHR